MYPTRLTRFIRKADGIMTLMSDSPGASPVQIDDRGRINQDLFCAACDYNLRTLETTGDCPECGVPVRRAIYIARLRLTDPGWLRSMSYSVFWICIGLGISLATVVVGFISHNLLLVVSVFTLAAVPVTLTLGLWQATRREPLRKAPATNTLRFLARTGLISGFCILLTFTALFPFTLSPNQPLFSGWIMVVVMLLWITLVTLGVVCGLCVGVAVATRIGKRLMLRIGIAFIAATLLVASPMLAKILLELSGELAWQIESWLFHTFGIYVNMNWLWHASAWVPKAAIKASGWGLFLLGLVLMVMLLWYRKCLREAAAAAERRLGQEQAITG